MIHNKKNLAAEVDTLEKALRKCRKCNHVKVAHLRRVCLEAEIIGSDKHICCKCIEFVPLDNLDYLEYKYSKNGGKKNGKKAKRTKTKAISR